MSPPLLSLSRALGWFPGHPQTGSLQVAKRVKTGRSHFGRKNKGQKPVRFCSELSASPVARPFPRLAEACRQVHGHAAAAGSGGIDHGRLPSGCTSGGRLPPLGRSNDRSPPTAMPTYPPHWAPPHARCRPCGVPFQCGCFSAPQSCARVFVGHNFALGARFRRRASRRFTPPPLCRALAPRL